MYCKARINVTQIKVETTIYYFNNKYNGEGIIEEKWNSWKNERKREYERMRISFFSWDTFVQRMEGLL